MKKNKFIIKTIRNMKTSLSLKDVVSSEMMDYLSSKIVGSDVKYEVEYLDERNVGNYIIFENNDIKNYIILLNYRNESRTSDGRNSFAQSIPTAYSAFIEDETKNKDIYFYDVHYYGGKYEPSIEMSLKIAMSMGIKELNDNKIQRYTSLDELITFRNENKKRNKQNNPSFIEKTEKGINIYGKVFGANSKDTELMCHAINNLYDGEITLYQIMDNKQKKLSKKFIEYLELTGKFIIKDNLYSFNDLVEVDDDKPEEVNLRNPRFINNLFEKYGDKKCALCECNIHQIIDGAHILPIEAIKELDLVDEAKLELATSADNGMWLCKNHHKLFDTHLIKFKRDNYILETELDNQHKEFILNSIRSNFEEIITSIDEGLLNLRNEFYDIEIL